MSSGPVLLPSYHQPPKAPQSVVLISTNQATPQQQQQQQTFTIENSEINKMNVKYLIQQHSKPLTITDVIPAGNVMSVTTSPANICNDKKRKHDSISDVGPSASNDTSKRPRPYSIPSKTSVTIPSSSSKDETNREIHNTIRSTVTDLLDRCSSFENDIHLCLNDLCQRVAFIVDQSLSDIFNQLPSPVFKRKMHTPTTKEVIHSEEHSQKNTSDLPLLKPSITTNTPDMSISTERKDEVAPQGVLDMKPTVSTTAILDYHCEWENCRASFSTARAVFHHVCSAHVKHSTDYVCLWNGCDPLRRQKWSLISHIQERHCSEVAFRQAKLRLTNSVSSTGSIPTNTSMNNNRTLISGGTTNGGYVSDAAWLAIRRHMQITSFDDQINKTKEGPLTKSIRLTAALILRNIARHSSSGKQNLRQYEQLLANLTLESSEASHILSSCLYELHN